MKNAQLRSIFALLLVFIIGALLIYALPTTLLTSPADNAADNDGYLSFAGSCTPTFNNSPDTHYNITNATLYTNIDGTWKANRTLNISKSDANGTFFANFTRVINQTPEGEFFWNIQCEEQNATPLSGNHFVRTSFAGNRTLTVRYANPPVLTTSPEDNSYSLNGHDINVSCSVNPTGGWNITEVSLMTDIRRYTESGPGENWTVNSTHIVAAPTSTGEVTTNFTINTRGAIGNASIPSGTQLLFGCFASQKKSFGDDSPTFSNSSSVNRTLVVEYPPNITIIKPVDTLWNQSKKVGLSWRVSSSDISSGTVFSTRVWTNESGVWSPRTGTVQSNNNTVKSLDYTFDELSQIVWGIQAFRKNDGNVFNFSVNQTIRIDTIDPVISVATPNGSNQTSTVKILFTPTEANNMTIQLLTNFNNTDARYNYTNTSANSGEEITVTFITVANGAGNFSITVTDNSTRSVFSGNYTINVDLTFPNIQSLRNLSYPQSCNTRKFFWDTNETTNMTFYIDTDTDTADGTVVTNSTKTFNHTLVVDYGLNREIRHFINITSCDTVGNCNTSNQFTFDSPASVCGGWNQYAVYDSFINLSTVQNQSGADLVYVFNATNQDWILFTAGLTTNEGVKIGHKTDYHVVHLFENVNSTWFRNTTNPGFFSYNVTQGSNFISVPQGFTFGNLTESFGNVSKDFPAFIGNDTAQFINDDYIIGPINITVFAGHNNSIQDYVSHIFNFTQANGTILEPCPNRLLTATCMESFWVASGFNVTWNISQINLNFTNDND